jgi:hypothetical protein
MVAAILALQQQLAHTDLQTVIAALTSSNSSPTLTSKRPRCTVFARFVIRSSAAGQVSRSSTAWQKNDVPNLKRGWDLESATALAAVGPHQAGPQGGDGEAVWQGPTSDALRF